MAAHEGGCSLPAEPGGRLQQGFAWHLAPPRLGGHDTRYGCDQLQKAGLLSCLMMLRCGSVFACTGCCAEWQFLVAAAVALMTKALQATGGILGFSRGSSVWWAVAFACLSVLLLHSQKSILFGLISVVFCWQQHVPGIAGSYYELLFCGFRGGGWQDKGLDATWHGCQALRSTKPLGPDALRLGAASVRAGLSCFTTATPGPVQFLVHAVRCSVEQTLLCQ
jgi:hypothetical protein